MTLFSPDHYAILSTFNTPSTSRPLRITKQVRNIAVFRLRNGR